HYISHSDEDYWHGEVTGGGRLDVDRNDRLNLDLAARRLTDARDSPDGVNGKEPTVYKTYHSGLAYDHDGSILLPRVEVGVDRTVYDDVETSTGATIDTGDRDRNEVYFDGRLGAQYLSPSEQVYVHVRGNDRNYDRSVDNAGRRRDSSGYRAEV